MPNIIEIISCGHSLEKYANKNRLLEDAVPYVGQAKQSEADPDKIFLRLNPLSSYGVLLEFETEDVLFAENVETVSRKDGTTFQVSKIWIRIGSIGIKLEPFAVQDFSSVFNKGFDA